MEWFNRKTSIAGVQIPNWGIVLGAVIVILFIYSAVIHWKHTAVSSTDQGGGKRRAGNSAPGMSVLTVVKPGGFMNRLLIVAILIIGTLPLYAQSQQPNAAELAQKVVGIIAGDKTKTQTYCQVLDLSDELDQVDQKKDRKKAEDLSQKINELQKKLGPEYLALLEATKVVDPNSKDGQEIVSIFDKLDSSCGD
jgi:hypothetical protein